VTITASVQLAGVFLVFASLAARTAPQRLRLPVGYAVGLAGYVLGLLASALYDFPTGAGAAIACLLTAVGALAEVGLNIFSCAKLLV
jgi:zinc/manganese transport system permease protein